MTTSTRGGSVRGFRIVGGRVLGPEGFGPAVVTTAGARIESVERGIEPPQHRSTAGTGIERIDARGMLVAPGFIDLQINGGFGLDLASAPLAMWHLADQLPRHGVTSFLPTIITGPAPVTGAALRALARRPADHAGAEPLGLHLEGPMLKPQRRGAHPERHLRSASLEVIEGWSREAGVAMATIAPDLPGSVEIIEELRARGIVVAGGHSAATARQTERAAEAGMTVVTHLFNAMEPLHHRHPGMVGQALVDDDLVASLIVDGIHLDPVAVMIAWRSKGPAGLALVTDAVAAMGRPPGTYDLGRQRITSDARGVRHEDGALAGSNLSLDAAVRNLVAFTGCDLADALATVTSTPARVLGDPDRGLIAAGARADLVLLDRHGAVQATMCGGQIVHVAEPASEVAQPA